MLKYRIVEILQDVSAGEVIGVVLKPRILKQENRKKCDQ